jgi:Tfp pilus assembly protein PilF
MPLRPSRPVSRAALILGLVALLLPFLSGASSAAKKSYSYETDPVRLGLKAVEEGRLDEAKANFEEALASEYETPKAHFGLAEILRREGLYADAEAKYR